jgi:phage baseplate assembly protein W
MSVQIPHFSYPFQFGGTKHADVLEQDFVDEVANCCVVILKCPIGMRIELPEFGSNDQAFQQVADAHGTTADVDAISAVLQRWEPRADAEVIGQVILAPDPLTIQVEIDVHGREGG